IGKTTNKMQNIFIVIVMISISLVVFTALYFGRNIAIYGKKLINTKDYLNNIIESSPDAIITTDMEGNIVEWSSGAEKMLGYTAEEMIGTSEAQLYVNPNERREIMKRLNINGYICNHKSKFIKKNGEKIDVSLSISLLKDRKGTPIGTVGISKNITHEVELQRKIRDKAKELEAIMNSTSDGIIVLDRNYNIVYYNKKMELHTGWKIEDAIGKHFREVTTSKDCDNACPVREVFKDGKSHTMMINAIDAITKEEIHGVVTASPIFDENNNIIACVETTKNITEIVKLQKDLEYAYKELKELDKMKSNFIDVVAHELRTPLAVIKGLVGVLGLDKENNLTEKQKEHLEVINKNTDVLNKLINDMLELSRVDSGMVELNYEEIDLSQIVKNVVKDFMPDINNNKQSISLNIPDSLIIEGEAKKITQIFSNLISNAIKYTPDGGKICIDIEERDKEVLVRVKDNGIGIPEKELSKVFERFYLVDADSLTREVDRIGLGLSIVKTNVKLHGGNIWVKSKLGKGSTFGFTLPKKR
ncbi:MAG: PAS domain S-box protein, partial [Methanosarcinales archaeon]